MALSSTPSSAPRAVIFGLAGAELSAAEKAFFAAANPLGFILFRRNCQSRAQTAALVRSLRQCTGRAAAPVLIDMEGGRVARLAPPVWPVFPPAAAFASLYRKNPRAACAAAFASARLIGAELAALGISWNAMPVLDMPAAKSDPVIGDRAYGREAGQVIALAQAAAAGLLAAGILPVIKHIPGHGRATADSHAVLPQVKAGRAALAAHDFLPFRALAQLPLAMTAHICYRALDSRPATLSPVVVEKIIRAAIGFDGLLLTDAIEMGALAGSLPVRARAALAAGCDVVLHCSGRLADMQAIARAVPPLAPAGRKRYARAQTQSRPAGSFDPAANYTILYNALAAAAA